MAAHGLAQRHAVRADVGRAHHHPLRLFQPGIARPGRRQALSRRPPAHRPGAGARAMRPVGLGHGARQDVLVALDVRHAGLRAVRGHALLRRGRPHHSSRRRRPVRPRQPDRGARNRPDRPGLPHAPRRRALGVDARPRPGHRPGGAGNPPDRHRRRRHRAAAPGAALGSGRPAAEDCDREHHRILRAVGRQRQAGDVQLEVPAGHRAVRAARSSPAFRATRSKRA